MSKMWRAQKANREQGRENVKVYYLLTKLTFSLPSKGQDEITIIAVLC